MMSSFTENPTIQTDFIIVFSTIVAVRIFQPTDSIESNEEASPFAVINDVITFTLLNIIDNNFVELKEVDYVGQRLLPTESTHKTEDYDAYISCFRHRMK